MAMRIKDFSSDKKYFTMVPNFILNHSSATDQALYLQMKRLVGDSEGVCYASEKYLKNRLKIGSKALKTSLKYLLEHKWIEEEGYRDVETAGGVQKVKTYLVKDIWKMNIDYYNKGVSESEPLNDKGVSESNARGVQKDAKGGRFQATKKNREKKNNEEELTPNGENREIGEIIFLFKEVNPTIGNLYGRINQRESVKRLIKLWGREELENIISFLPMINSTPYAPIVTTPLQLEEKAGKIKAFIQQQQNKRVEQNQSRAVIF